MRHLLGDLPAVKRRLEGCRILLLLDYDGTLTEIVARPELAKISSARKRILRKLAACRSCDVAIISGRGLADVKRMVGISGLIYSGSHGFELRGPDMSYLYEMPPRIRAAMSKLRRLVSGELGATNGVIIEKKKFSFCVHYRQCSPSEAAYVRRIVTQSASLFVVRGLLRLSAGKKVIEVLPPDEWSKGRIVTWLMAAYGRRHPDERVLPVFIGDDLTDETAFRALRGRGVTVFVGRPRKSAAQYFLRNVAEVYDFLRYVDEYLMSAGE